MKKIGFLLQMLAFVCAVGAAFAFSASPAQIGYKPIAQAPWCDPIVTCNELSDAICQDASSVDLFDGSVMNSTSCGVRLTHRP